MNNKIKTSFVLLLALPSLLWWLAESPTIQAMQDKGFFALRSLLVDYSGVLAIAVMSIAMLLALRSVRAEALLGGMDKGFRLHKWLGITGLALAVLHWLWAKGPKWAVGWGWLERPERGHGAHPEQTVALFRFFQEQRGTAEMIGEWAFYAFVALALVALIKRFPYRRFFQSHRLMALVYLALVVHAVILLPFDHWSTPLGVFLAVLLAGGSVAAVVSLTGRIGARHRFTGRVESVVEDTGQRLVEVVVRVTDAWPGHRAGQFAFVRFDRDEGAHPYTISSAWRDDGRIRFHIKALGDYTAQLPALLRAGGEVTVEGPYGKFDFDDPARRQIWVAGGVGITPFIARLQARADRGTPVPPADLFYSTDTPDGPFMEALRDSAVAAGVKLHVTPPDAPRLDADRICRAVPGWRDASLWFCGPAGFGRMLRRAFANRGLSAGRFHQELFAMR